MRNKWKEMSAGDKTVIATRIVLSIVIIVLGVLQITGALDRTLDFAVPLLGLYMLVVSCHEWKQNRGAAILSSCVAAFLFVVTGVVWFGR